MKKGKTKSEERTERLMEGKRRNRGRLKKRKTRRNEDKRRKERK